MTHVILTFAFWSGNGLLHTVTSYVVFVPNMKWICQIGMEPRNRHDKNFERAVT